jgi:hypothetical protein
MLLDLSKGDCPTHLATLGLTESVAELADANIRYQALTAQRTTSVSDAKTPDSKSFRAELDALYVYISDVAFAHNVVPHYRTGPLYPRRERYKHFYQRLSPTQFICFTHYYPISHRVASQQSSSMLQTAEQR